MASFPCNAYSPSFPAGLPGKRNIVLDYLATTARLVDVRPASRLEVRPKPEMASSGIAQVDALAGGLPRGCLSELCGSPSSGKTSTLLAVLAAATRREESCVLIDASDSFDPESGAAAGINFAKLLWVRCGKKRSTVSILTSDTKSLVVGCWSSANNSSIKFKGTYKERSNFPEISHHCSSAVSFEANDQRPTTNDDFQIKTRSERRLGQVLKITDLVLQSGGFGLVVLDLAGIPEKYVRRIPLASWFRFQRAVENTKTALLVVDEFPCAKTCASVVLKLGAEPSAISYQPSAKPSHAQLLEKMQIDVDLSRTRLERKPMQSVKATFETRAVRAG
jgi:hypothetical protein